MTTGRGWRKPDLPQGPLRELNDALHGLHARAGYLSCRKIADAITARSDCDAVSHTTVRAALSKPALPGLRHVMAIVQVLAGFTRSKNPEHWLDLVDELWQRASATEESVFSSDDPAIDAAVKATQRLHVQRSALLEQQVIAQREFIRRAASLRDAEPPDWWQLLEAYDQVRAWKIKGHQDWMKLVGIDRPTLRRLAHAVPRNADGVWRGDTGWDGLDDSVLPPRGSDIAYALFDTSGKAVRVGLTNQFRAHVKRLHRRGVTWTAWQAWSCEDRAQAVAKRRAVAEQYGHR